MSPQIVVSTQRYVDVPLAAARRVGDADVAPRVTCGQPTLLVVVHPVQFPFVALELIGIGKTECEGAEMKMRERARWR